MLFLLFQLGQDRYALEANRVVEVVPLLTLRRLPQTVQGVAGVFNYRGRLVPALDLCDLTSGQPAPERFSTRIIVIHYDHPSGGNHLLGLVAERATELLRTEARQFVPTGMKRTDAPWLGPVLMDGKGPILWLHHQGLLPDPVYRQLFSQTAEGCLTALPCGLEPAPARLPGAGPGGGRANPEQAL